MIRILFLPHQAKLENIQLSHLMLHQIILSPLMTDLHLQILHQIANTYNNILNNNLNDTMKFLTLISILMTIPDIVTGFFGMNVQIPFTEFRHGWAIILLIIALGWIGVSQIIKRIMKD